MIYGRAMSLRLRLAAPRLIRPSRAQETARSDVLVVLQLVLLLLARSASGGGLKLIVCTQPCTLEARFPPSYTADTHWYGYLFI